VAIVQVSRITNRKGLAENLPQLAGAELGWAIDERRLFIGNGTLEEGAPTIGNTEILTEYSTDALAALLNNVLINLNQLSIGSWTRTAGVQQIINNSQTNQALFTFSTDTALSFRMEYMIKREIAPGSIGVKSGTLNVVASTDGTGSSLNSNDSNLENTSVGVTLSAVESAGFVTVRYTSTNTGFNGTIDYSITYLG
jgi:hypothetical protein